MKIFSHPARSREYAFTLPEMIISSGVFILMMAGIIYGYLFGLSLFQVTKAKLSATDDARKAFIRLTDEIRSANAIQIGAGNLTNFVEMTTNGIQAGMAMRIYPSTNLANFVVYWYETNSANKTNFTKLMRRTDNVTGRRVVSLSITNTQPIFSSEDSSGNYLTNNVNNRVIGVTLQFYQTEYPSVSIGPGGYYDFYQLHTRITRRILY
jgi:type II secretory pathway pseudopilin PulG